MFFFLTAIENLSQDMSWDRKVWDFSVFIYFLHVCLVFCYFLHLCKAPWGLYSCCYTNKVYEVKHLEDSGRSLWHRQMLGVFFLFVCGLFTPSSTSSLAVLHVNQPEHLKMCSFKNTFTVNCTYIHTSHTHNSHTSTHHTWSHVPTETPQT